MTALYISLVIIVLSYVAKLASRRRVKINHRHLILDAKSKNILRKLRYFTFFSYGSATVYILNYFTNNMLIGWQPLFFSSFIIIALTLLIGVIYKNTEKATTWFWLFCGGAGVLMLLLLATNLNFSRLVIKQAYSLVTRNANSDYAYCIQIYPNYKISSDYNVDTLLSLSLLKMKPRIVKNKYGRYRNHKADYSAVLVIKKENSIELYDWSYWSKKWSYIEPKYDNKNRSKSLCTPSKKFLQQIPLIFPKQTK